MYAIWRAFRAPPHFHRAMHAHLDKHPLSRWIGGAGQADSPLKKWPQDPRMWRHVIYCYGDILRIKFICHLCQETSTNWNDAFWRQLCLLQQTCLNECGKRRTIESTCAVWQKVNTSSACKLPHKLIQFLYQTRYISSYLRVVTFVSGATAPVDQGLLIHEVSRSHTTTHHSR
jgi:hypothetical protein